MYTLSKSSFSGGEYYFKAIHEPSYFIKSEGHTKSEPISWMQPYDLIAEYASFGLNYSLADKNLQVLFLPFSLISPLLIKPIQTGIPFYYEKKTLFYLSEIGFRLKGFHLSTGYNVVFRNHLKHSWTN